MWRINPKPIILMFCSVVCALYLWAQQPPATAREPSSPTPATPHLPQPPHLPISPSPTNPMDTTSQPTLGDHRDGVVSVAFSPDGRLATGETDGMARIWDAQGRLVMTLKASDRPDEPINPQGHFPGHIWYVAFSPNGENLATLAIDGTVRIWNRQGTLLIEDKGAGSPRIDYLQPKRVVFSPDSKLVAVVAEKYEYVKLWTIQTRQWVKLQDSQRIPYSITLGTEFSPDSSKLFIYGDYNLRLWDTQGRLLAEPEEINMPSSDSLRVGTSLAGLYTTAFSPDSSIFVVHDYILDADGQIVGRLEQGEAYQKLPVMNFLLEFSSDSNKLTSTDYMSPVGYVWNRQGRLLLKLFPYKPREDSLNPIIHHPVLAATFSPDSRRLVTNATLQESDPLKLWDSQGDQLALVANLEGHQGKVPTMTFSPDSHLLATIDDYNIRLWDQQGKLLKTLPNKQDERELTLKLQFSPDSSRLISHGIKRKKSNQTFTLNVWEVSDL